MDQNLYEEYEKLLLERDSYEKLAGAALTKYIAEFGQLINDAFALKIECIKLKKSITYAQRYVNQGQPVDVNALNAYIDTEMAGYQAQLREKIDTFNRCKNAGTSSDAEVIKAKNIYRRIAKRIHPDINPMIFENEEIQDLWDRVKAAYHKNDYKTLAELEVIINNILKEAGFDYSTPEIEDIEEKIQELKDEIERIKTTDPYLYIELLEDEEAVKTKKEDLQKEIDEYKEYRDRLQETLDEILANGMVMTWQNN